MRKQAKTKDGTLRWAVTYPKAFQGDKAVAKPLKEKPTYGKNMQIIKKRMISLSSSQNTW